MDSVVDNQKRGGELYKIRLVDIVDNFNSLYLNRLYICCIYATNVISQRFKIDCPLVHVVHVYAAIPRQPPVQIKIVVDNLDKLKTLYPYCPQSPRPPAKKKM